MKNGQIEGMISMRMLILSNTIQEVITYVRTKCQSPRCSSSCEIFDKTLYWRERKNGPIKGMISMRMLILSYTIQHIIPNVCTNFKILGAVVPEKSLTEKKVNTHTAKRWELYTLLYVVRGSCKKFCHWVRFTSVLPFIKHIFLQTFKVFPLYWNTFL